MSTPILLDCDPGHDDAIAMLLALGSPELELRGIATVAGNQTLEKTTANAIRVLELAGSELPVAAAAGARGGGGGPSGGRRARPVRGPGSRTWPPRSTVRPASTARTCRRPAA